MWLVAAVLSLGAAYLACLALVLTARRRPLPLAAAVALATTICVEACVVHALSAFHGVSRPGLLAGHAVVALGLGGWARARARGAARRRLRLPALTPAGFALLALAPLILFSALAYPPNNWDSMTYHLARVAHWIQNRSVGAYPTRILRQLALPPGAEYLLLGLQVVAGSDRLGPLIQLGCWIVVAAAAPPLARTFGVPRRFAPWTALVAAGGAMAVLQASGTQNDLVAAAIAVAIVASCLPFLHRSRLGWGAWDVALVALAVVAGAATKPVAVLCAAPLLAWSAWRALPRLRQRTGWQAALRALPVLAVAAAVLLPAAAAARRATPSADLFGPYLYPGLAELRDRPLNIARGLARNLPLPLPSLERLLAPRHTPGCAQEHGLCLALNAAPLEDHAASAGPAALLLLGLALAGARWRRLPPRARLGVVAWCCAWVLFHAVLRDNPWITRLQLPLFALAPLALGALARPGAAVERALLALLLACSAAHAAFAVTLDFKRPLAGAGALTASAPSPARVGDVRGVFTEEGYYRLGPQGLGPLHDAILRELSRTGCRRLAVYLGEDSWEYPLTWRAMRGGVEVRHLVGGEDDWACAVFSDRGEPPALAAARARWSSPPGLPALLLRAGGAATAPASGGRDQASDSSR